MCLLQSAYPARAFTYGDILGLMDCGPLFELEKEMMVLLMLNVNYVCVESDV